MTVCLDLVLSPRDSPRDLSACTLHEFNFKKRSNGFKWSLMLFCWWVPVDSNDFRRFRAKCPRLVEPQVICGAREGRIRESVLSSATGVHKLSRNYDYLHLIIIINGHASWRHLGGNSKASQRHRKGNTKASRRQLQEVRPKIY